MKLLFNKYGKIDLENPVYMEEDQFEKFISFLRNLLRENIEIKNVNEKERFINPDTKRHPKKWDPAELILLLDSKVKDNELIKKLGRSQMSIGMQRAQFIPEFISWAKSKGFEANKITRTIIKQFLEERDENS
jgi:hypothetical protein